LIVHVFTDINKSPVNTKELVPPEPDIGYLNGYLKNK